MGIVKNAAFQQATGRRIFSFVSFFVRSESRFFVPTRTSLALARAEAVKVGRRTNFTTGSAVARPHLDSFEHDGTLGAVGMTIRGEPAFRARIIAPRPCIRWVQDRTMIAPSPGAKSRAGPAAIAVAMRAIPSSRSPRPAPSSASATLLGFGLFVPKARHHRSSGS